MRTIIEVIDSDAEGQNGGTAYKVTSEIVLTDIINKTDDELRAALYPREVIDYIRGQLVRGD